MGLMSSGSDDGIVQQIAVLLASGRVEAVREAVALVPTLSAPSAHLADETAHTVFQVGQQAEMLEDASIASALYRRVLEYPVESVHIHAGAWYRLGECQRRAGDLAEAAQSYRHAIAGGALWPNLVGHARLRLADILSTTEDYDEAARILADLEANLTGTGIHPHEAIVKRARCLLFAGKSQEAQDALLQIAADPPSEYGVDGGCLLAEIYESLNDRKRAREAYKRILADPFAKTEIRAAANYRLAALK
jgi:tetratricopeptide (TPR) repeat protein